MLISGVNGVMRGLQGLDNAAQEIAELNISQSPSESSGGTAPRPAFSIEEMASAVIDLKLYQRQVEASTQVVKTAEEMLGFLLDVRS